MNTHLAPEQINAYQTPAIRHLAWLCQAPQLMHSPITFEPTQHLPSHYPDILRAWDLGTETAPALLSEPPQRRLGFYFERLYQVLLEDLLGWPILLKNQQIQANGRTIGELDFVVHNRAEDRIEHHEIAIKFYLGVVTQGIATQGVVAQAGSTAWYGPNARDRLDLKTSRLLEQQSCRTQLPETLALLAESQITGPLMPQIFMPGYLFFPDNLQAITPDYVPKEHLRGRWMYIHNAKALDTSHWIALNKPHWIGSWVQNEQPDAAHTLTALEHVESRSTPQLFAVMLHNPQTGIWQETDRVFVVPATWPGPL